MLTLQRASAGSGKTYTLAKTFIRLLLSAPSGDGSRRLRHPKETKDTLPRILAITFTNKATAEMKQRILSALAAIGDEDADDNTTYFKDLRTEFGTTPGKLRATARAALEELLGNYSDFKVSTIDTFFQTILRTFTYETHLNDNYGVEIDTDFIYGMAIDTLMEEIDMRSGSSDTCFWFRTLMELAAGEGKKWNVFSKGPGIYSSILSALRQFESESFKGIREVIEEYCAERSLAQTYREMEEWNARRLEVLVHPVKEAMRALADFAASRGLDDSMLGAGTKGAVKAYRAGEMPASLSSRFGQMLASSARIPDKNAINAAGEPLIEAYKDAATHYLANCRCHWDHYRDLFPFMGLMQEAHGHIRDFLTDNNLIILADTNTLLKRIISDDDTPFIYERLGSRLDHLLIDEFQDTSRMQWDNIRPLLAQPLSRGEECLVIGDAKQSIYRFRNADPSIITSCVPAAFPNHIPKGDRKEENTNYRSERNVVQFNNYLFSRLSSILGRGMEDLYSNVDQIPKHQDACGYVEYRELPTGKKDMMDQVGPMVASLMARGYRQKDICFLVRTKSEAARIIDAFVEYNNSRPQGDPNIEFISEQSLLISSSRGVNTIVNCLKNIADASALKNNPKYHQDAPAEESTRVDWEDVRAELIFFIASHPELTPDEQIEAFFNQKEHPDLLGEMVAGMQSATLPALTEALAAQFVTDEIKRTDAPYIAAFQDCVLDYCGNYATDISSFLEWWTLKGSALSIASPENVDAVQVMTIHKSKGLEFPVVIMTDCSLPVLSSPKKWDRAEWKWVAPRQEAEGIPLPKQVPVFLTRDLEGSDHEQDFLDYQTLTLMDSLNSLYVAFTRARCELYINKTDKRPDQAEGLRNNEPKIMARYIPDIFSGYANAEGDMKFPDASLLEVQATEDPEGEPDGGMRVCYGSPLSEAEIAEKVIGKDGKADSGNVLEKYFVNPDICFLKYREADLPSGSPVKAKGDDGNSVEPMEEDLDPRSKGNLLHAAMQWIEREEDADRALRKLKCTGLLDYKDLPYFRDHIARALAAVRDREWFTGRYEVMAERAILQRGEKTFRPDRIMKDPDTGECIVIDYKFGERPLPVDRKRGLEHEHPAYRKQVEGYVELLRHTGLYTSVKAYIWYVHLGRIFEITPEV